MNERHFAILEDRGRLAVAGPDAATFLQGLITNDIARADGAHAIYAALLTAQGKFLHDFFIVRDSARPDGYLVDGEGERLADLSRRLGIYRLRANVTIAPADPSLATIAVFGAGAGAVAGLDSAPTGTTAPFAGGIAFVDPRLPDLGLRVVAPRDAAVAALAAAGTAPADAAAYDLWRLRHGVPDGSRDIAVEKAFPLECNLDELNAIDYRKGCYVGQELTARTHHRATLRKRLIPVRIAGTAGAGTPILCDGREVGELRTAREGHALAVLRLDALNGPPLRAGDADVVPAIPSWLSLPASGDASA
jgi:folate-binding protein YgfZ